MPERQIRELFAVWQARLGLAEWRIRVDFEEIDPETTTMEVHRSPYYQRATVKVQPWVLTNSPPREWRSGGSFSDLDIEEAVVHELLHCVVTPLRGWMGLLKDETHRDALDVATSALVDLEETVVDKLAVALVAAFGCTPREG